MDIPQPPPYLRRDWQCQSRWLVLGAMVEFSTERTHNANASNGTLRQQRGTDKKNWIMEIVIEKLIDHITVNTQGAISPVALELIGARITEQLTEACIKALGDFTLRQDDTQNRQICPFAKRGSASSISATQQSAGCVPSGNAQTESEELKHLRQTIRVVKHLVRVQDRSMPIRHRKYDPILLDSLLYQIENLLNTLDHFALPRLTRIDNSRY